METKRNIVFSNEAVEKRVKKLHEARKVNMTDVSSLHWR